MSVEKLPEARLTTSAEEREIWTRGSAHRRIQF
jgi:hypothetical protein